MPRRPSPDPDEQLLGAQTAANHLRIHRSTLHLAVRQGTLVPDARTAGGHVRFKRETLDAYCARFSMGGPATGESAVAAPMRALAELAQLLATTAPLEAVGEAAVAGVRRALPGIDACAVAMVRPEAGDPHALQSFALFGFPEQVQANYRRLRRTFRFASTTAMRTLEPEICENTAARQLYSGTLQIARIWQLGAYALFPMIAVGEPLGLLLCVSHTPRRFSASERAFLQAVADQLAIAIRRTVQRPSPAPMEATEMLLRTALELHARAPQGGITTSAAAKQLSSLYQRLSGARDVYTTGFGLDLDERSEPRLHALAERARTASGTVSERWHVGGETYTALAIGLPLGIGRYAAVASAWRGGAACDQGAGALLLAFSTAYLLTITNSAE